MSFKNAFKERWQTRGGYGEFFALAVPLIMSTSLWSIQHFVNRMFLTWYSPESIAAAMPAGLLNFTIVSLFIGTASYTGTFVAQYFGAGMHGRIGPAVWQGIYFSLIGAAVSLLAMLFAGPIFDLTGHDPNVRVLEVAYFKVLSFASFPMIASSAMAGYFSGQSRPWPVFFVDIAVTLINIALDYCMIFGNFGFAEMGIRGAGIASVISACIAFFIYVLLTAFDKSSAECRFIKGRRFDKELFGRLLKYGFPSGIQFFIDMAGFTLFLLLVGRLGIINLAATNIAFNINTLAFMPMIGAGVTVSILTGQYLGMEKPELAVKSTWTGFHVTILYMGTVAALFAFAPGIFVNLYDAKSHAAEMARISALAAILLRFVALYSIFDSMNIIFSSTLKGAGDTRFVMVMIIMASILSLIVPTWLAVDVFKAGIYACWVIASAYVILLSFAFFLRFRSGRWKAMRVIERHASVIPVTIAECPDARPE